MKKKFCLLTGLLLVLFFCGCSNEKRETGYYYEIPTCNTFLNATQDTTFVDCVIEPWYDGKEKVVVFTWDDCYHGISEVVDLFDRYGLKTTFFVNTAVIDDLYRKIRFFYKGTLNGVVKYALTNGHEVSSHTHDHLNLSKLTLEQVKDQFEKSSNYIFEKYGYYPSTLSHPESFYNESIDSLMRLYYLDSRYSVKNDKDTTIRYFHIRSSYPFKYYKKNFDSFIQSTSDEYVYGGHQLRGGYEPMAEATLDSLLSYITDKYSDLCWVATYEDVVLYKRIREGVIITNEGGILTIDISGINDILSHYTHPHAFLTLRFKGENLDFSSEGLVKYHYDGNDSYCTIDLRKTNELRYSVVDKNFVIQEPMRCSGRN